MVKAIVPEISWERAGLGLLAGAVAAVYLLAALGIGKVTLPRRTAAVPDFSEILKDLPRGEGGHHSARLLHDTFDRIGYRLDAVAGDGDPVPPILLARMPRDLAHLAPVDARKRVFLQVILPQVLHVNQSVLRDRARLLEIKERAPLEAGGDDAAWLAALSERYAVAGDIDRLLTRVDAIPVSLALAQAAEESGWGTSRFAREGNALFGQWSFSGIGLVPVDAADKGHRVRSFATLVDAVRAYAHNLNTHRAYAEFRRLRAALRAADGRALDGEALAGSLGHYSERRDAYVDSLRSIIRANNLRAFDAARLGEREATVAGAPY